MNKKDIIQEIQELKEQYLENIYKIKEEFTRIIIPKIQKLLDNGDIIYSAMGRTFIDNYITGKEYIKEELASLISELEWKDKLSLLPYKMTKNKLLTKEIEDEINNLYRDKNPNKSIPEGCVDRYTTHIRWFRGEEINNNLILER